MCDQIGVAVENINLFEEVKNKSAELECSNAELREALEQQTATSEVLRVIASSPTQLQPVLDTLIANAVRLSGATRGHVRQYDGEFHRVVAHYGETPEMIATLRANPLPATPELPAARALLSGQPIHILDVRSETGVHLDLVRQMGTRTMLAVPLLREGTNIGSLTIWRDFVEPFTERQIELVKTFADQAVIAIENVRLFQELKESLEQQTATSEILGVIASSPTDIAASAGRNRCERGAGLWRDDVNFDLSKGTFFDRGLAMGRCRSLRLAICKSTVVRYSVDASSIVNQSTSTICFRQRAWNSRYLTPVGIESAPEPSSPHRYYVRESRSEA